MIIDIQNDITKNYKEIIFNINSAIQWAFDSGIAVVYIKHENVSAGYQPTMILIGLLDRFK